jgi:hypothetical protein
MGGQPTRIVDVMAIPSRRFQVAASFLSVQAPAFFKEKPSGAASKLFELVDRKGVDVLPEPRSRVDAHSL